MSKIELIMPKMGESVAEATIIKWTKDIGDSIELDETVVEIATDKVDSEIPSITKGILKEKLYKENDVVKVGEVIAIIEDGNTSNLTTDNKTVDQLKNTDNNKSDEQKTIVPAKNIELDHEEINNSKISDKRFYSPLVKNIAKKENISHLELSQIKGTGTNNRVTKKDIINHIKQKNTSQEIDLNEKNITQKK